MKKILLLFFSVAVSVGSHAARPQTSLQVYDIRKQTVTGFGGACCDGAMKPFGNDNACVSKLYGYRTKIGLNILRMEISPSFTGDNWGDYDWNGSLPSAKVVKDRGGIVFGTPWSPPGEYKTNGTAQGGNAEDQGNQKGKLRTDCYDKFFPWLNTFLAYMKKNGVNVDAVSIQNEPDWWVNYSGCLYTPQEQVDLVKNHAHMLDRETYKGVRLISAEPLGFDPSYSNTLLNSEAARNQIDIVAGHIYGHPPLGDLKTSAKKAAKYSKEVWMTEHSVSDNIIGRLPNWTEQLEFARELNECMLAGCTGYIYWYMRAHWAFVGTGESEYGTDNKKNKLLPRAFVLSHFAKHDTGSTLLESKCSISLTTNASIETSAFIKGDSLIVMAINSTKNERDLKIKLPYSVKSGELLQSTGNETDHLCQQQELTISEPVQELTVTMPAQSLNTYIFMLEQSTTAIRELTQTTPAGPKTYYDLQGRRLTQPHGLCIERLPNGTSRKVYIDD